MNILFDAFWWVEGPFSNRTVQRELIEAWVREFPEDEVTLLVPHRHLAAARADSPARARLLATRLRPHGVAMAVGAPIAARRARAGLVVAHNFTPVAGRSAVFVHDVLFQSDPAWFTRPERAYFAWIPLLARRAELVATSSHSEAARISGRNPGLRRVLPIGLAVRSELQQAEPVRPAALPGVDDFLLTVGRLNVRKNLTTTIAAALQSGRVTPTRPLVVVGAEDGRSPELPDFVRRAFADGSVVALPSVDDAELSWLYRNARLFVFLSLDEGFGLTPVEALTFGAPCVVSDIPVFRETLGDHVAYVAPVDIGAAAAAIVTALDGCGPATDRNAVDAVGLSWAASVHRLRTALAG